jgi:hypothetical protein
MPGSTKQTEPQNPLPSIEGHPQMQVRQWTQLHTTSAWERTQARTTCPRLPVQGVLCTSALSQPCEHAHPWSDHQTAWILRQATSSVQPQPLCSTGKERTQAALQHCCTVATLQLSCSAIVNPTHIRSVQCSNPSIHLPPKPRSSLVPQAAHSVQRYETTPTPSSPPPRHNTSRTIWA